MRRSAPVTFGTVRARTPLVSAGLRVGLLGGTFNPPHAAHRQISRIALARLGLDQVWWLVTPGNPLKSNGGLPALEDRMAAARRVADDPRIVVTGFEDRLASPFTAATIAFLRRRHPRVRFVWLMGADCLAQFHRWRQWRTILETVPVAVVDRPNWHLAALASPAARTFASTQIPEMRSRELLDRQPPCWTMLTGPLSPLSSTALRERSARRNNGS